MGREDDVIDITISFSLYEGITGSNCRMPLSTQLTLFLWLQTVSIVPVFENL